VLPSSTAEVGAVEPPPKPSFLRKHKAWALAAVLVLGAAGALALRWWLGPEVATAAVLRRDFVQSVVASGHVEAPHRLDVGAQITATVLRVPVVEGQVVKAGELLVELDALELKASDRQAEAAVVQARSRLRQLNEVQAPVAAQTLRQAQATLAAAVAAYGRSQSLFDQGFIGQAALDEVLKARDLADAQMRVTQRQLESTGLAGSDRALAMADLAGAQANAQASSARAGHAVIRAPVDGTLIARNVEVGDVGATGPVR
jgi:HlyD family secretion protein